MTLSLRPSETISTSTDFDLLDLHQLNPQRYPYLLQSKSIGPQGRFDILFAFPGASLFFDEQNPNTFLSELESNFQQEAIVNAQPTQLPFTGGWFLYLGYELAAVIEPTLCLPKYEGRFPTAFATRVPAAVIHDHATGLRVVVSEEKSLLLKIVSDIANCKKPDKKINLNIESIQEECSSTYINAVKKIIDYIVEGDVFQVNLSRQWSAVIDRDLSNADLYIKLRAANPGPFNGLVTWGNQALFSSSPERLVSMQSDVVETRPIAGTRPRNEEVTKDEQLSDELMTHPKELAEHVMLVDLERNDMGRFAVPGSIDVNELMVLESYTTVHHIVSNIKAIKRPEISPIDVIKAVFPGGTITGCPKVRCMEIIAELEKTGRGPYTGSMGYLDRNGNMDLNILIRTIVRDNDEVNFRAGAGIVADSDPLRELDETRAKANGMLAALGVS